MPGKPEFTGQDVRSTAQIYYDALKADGKFPDFDARNKSAVRLHSAAIALLQFEDRIRYDFQKRGYCAKGERPPSDPPVQPSASPRPGPRRSLRGG